MFDVSEFTLLSEIGEPLFWDINDVEKICLAPQVIYPDDSDDLSLDRTEIYIPIDKQSLFSPGDIVYIKTTKTLFTKVKVNYILQDLPFWAILRCSLIQSNITKQVI